MRAFNTGTEILARHTFRELHSSFVVTILVTPANKLAVCQSTGAPLDDGKGKLPLVRVSYCYRGKLLVSYW